MPGIELWGSRPLPHICILFYVGPHKVLPHQLCAKLPKNRLLNNITTKTGQIIDITWIISQIYEHIRTSIFAIRRLHSVAIWKSTGAHPCFDSHNFWRLTPKSKRSVQMGPRTVASLTQRRLSPLSPSSIAAKKECVYQYSVCRATKTPSRR